MFSRSWRPALAIALAAGVGWSAGTAQAQVTYTTTEAKLTQILQANRYGGHNQVWADIRTEPVSAWGKSYPGHISIHARDTKGQECIWFLVIEPKLQSDWFVPRIYNRYPGCWSTELNDDYSVLAYGVSVWRLQALDVISRNPKSPIGNPRADLLGKVEYYADKVVFSVHELKIKIPETMRPGITERPLLPRTFR